MEISPNHFMIHVNSASTTTKFAVQTMDRKKTVFKKSGLIVRRLESTLDRHNNFLTLR